MLKFFQGGEGEEANQHENWGRDYCKGKGRTYVGEHNVWKKQEDE